MKRGFLNALMLSLGLWASQLPAADWLMFGRDHARNAVSQERNPPLDWNTKTGGNIEWNPRIGSHSFATPVRGDREMLIQELPVTFAETQQHAGRPRLICLRRIGVVAADPH